MLALTLVLSLGLFTPAAARLRKLAALVPELSYMTEFAHDYGERIAYFTFRGERYQPDEASVKILPQLDWAARSDRLLLGEAWAEEVCLYGWEVLTPSHPGAREVPLPKAEILPDGTFRYTATARSMRGRTPGSPTTRWQIEIDLEGRNTQSALSSNSLR